MAAGRYYSVMNCNPIFLYECKQVPRLSSPSRMVDAALRWGKADGP